MSGDEPKKKLIGPWSSLHLVIWLVGIYILATRNWWWPGILILIAISALYEAFIQRYVPGSFIEEKTTQPAAAQPAANPPTNSPSLAPPPAVTLQEHRIELLPPVCPACNGPILGHEVKWTGPQSASCPYCGSNLPLSKA